jgi:hypothetical protein
MEVYFQGIWRMDWGLGNPNKTAALIATLMVAVWMLAAIRRAGFWLALTLCVGLAICLVHTMSRGGLLAAIIGLVPVLLFARPWRRNVVVGCLVGLAVALVAMGLLGATKRLSQGVNHEDRSITNRIELWKTAPAMMFDAPGGWGLGTSGTAYMQWYQTLDKSEGYRTLVNSHLTWLVEIGWPMRVLYIIGWGVILVWCWPGHSRSLVLAATFGVWLAFGVACWFSSVAESVWLWITPILSLLVATVIRVCGRQLPSRSLVTTAVTGSFVLGGFIFTAGMLTSSRMVCLREGVVYWGRTDSSPQAWILPDKIVFGEYYGPHFRREMADHQDFSAAFLLDDALIRSASSGALLVGARSDEVTVQLAKRWVANGGRLILINPRIHPSQIAASGHSVADVQVIFGEFSEAPGKQSWKNVLGVRNRIVLGVADYWRSWPQTLVNAQTGNNK